MSNAKNTNIDVSEVSAKAFYTAFMRVVDLLDTTIFQLCIECDISRPAIYTWKNNSVSPDIQTFQRLITYAKKHGITIRLTL